MRVKHVLRWAIAAALSSHATISAAQEAQPAATPTTELESVIVTGSYIRGTAEDAALPVDVITAEDLSQRGSPSTLDLIKSLPASAGVLGDTNQFDGRGSQGTEGAGTVNLRGLGPQRTLVLLNGRRLVNNPLTGAVDTNTIPFAAIGRVEVLKDGAAATYGSDAIAGVVNFITKTRLEGFDFSGSYSYIDESDGDYNAGLSFGWVGDNVDFLISAGYDHRSQLRVVDRDFAVLDYTANPEGGWSGGGMPTGYVLRSAPTAMAPLGATTGTLRDPSCAPLGGFPGVTGTGFPICNFQFTVFDNLVEKQDRYQGYAEINVDFGPAAKWHSEAMYAFTDVPDYKTSPSFLTTQGPTGQTLPSGLLNPNYFVPASNPGVQRFILDNPTITTFQGLTAPSAALMGGGVLLPALTWRPFAIGGNPLYPDGSGTAKREYEAFRVSTGFKGDITDSLFYDVAVTYSEETVKRDAQDTVADRIQLALRGFGGPNCPTPTPTQTAGAGVGNCFYFNPFGNAIPGNPITGQANPFYNVSGPGQGNTSRELIEWFFQKYPLYVDQSLGVADLVFSGLLGLELPGGEIGWAAGAQYRMLDYSDRRAPINDLARNACVDSLDFPAAPCTTATPSFGSGVFVFLGGGFNQDLSQDVYAGFLELSLPITESLDAQLAARYERYDQGVGSTFDPKLALRWEIVEQLAFRGSIGTTFRGPPATVLSGQATALQNIFNSFRAVDVLGNPDLEPEKALTFNVGTIVKAGPFTATVDYWNFKFEDPIVIEPLLGIVNSLFPNGTVAPIAGNPATSNNCGIPAFAALQSRFTFSGAGCSGANISRVRTSFVNGPTTKTDGLDFSAKFAWDVGPGSMTAGLDATYVLSYDIDAQSVEGIEVQTPYDAVGKFNIQTTAFPLPELRGSVFANYGFGDHNLRLVTNYIHDYEDQRTNIFLHNNYPSLSMRSVGTPQVATGKHIASWTTFDAHYNVLLPANLGLALSVVNVTDRDPPFVRAELNYDTFTHNPLGRVIKASLTTKF